jgi:hypothetical protein
MATPPSPRDESNPTLRELRRQVGFLTVLSQYRLHTCIVATLVAKPYGIPLEVIERLIRIADIASISRRCYGSQNRIDFEYETAADILFLTEDLFDWYATEKGEHVLT